MRTCYLVLLFAAFLAPAIFRFDYWPLSSHRVYDYPFTADNLRLYEIVADLRDASPLRFLLPMPISLWLASSPAPKEEKTQFLKARLLSYFDLLGIHPTRIMARKVELRRDGEKGFYQEKTLFWEEEQ